MQLLLLFFSGARTLKLSNLDNTFHFFHYPPLIPLFTPVASCYMAAGQVQLQGMRRHEGLNGRQGEARIVACWVRSKRGGPLISNPGIQEDFMRGL